LNSLMVVSGLSSMISIKSQFKTKVSMFDLSSFVKVITFRSPFSALFSGSAFAAKLSRKKVRSLLHRFYSIISSY
jgi:hypothetical protein